MKISTVDNPDKRCRSICGERQGCFADQAEHLDCISDMVINRVWGVRSMIAVGRDMNACSNVDDALDMADKALTEIITWIVRLREEQAEDAMEVI